MMLNVNAPIKDDISIIIIQKTTAATFTPITKAGFRIHPLLVLRENKIPPNKLKQLPATVSINSDERSEYSWPKIFKMCSGKQQTANRINDISATINNKICINFFINIVLAVGNLANLGIIKVLNNTLIKDSNIANRLNAPICAIEAVLPKIDISQIVICPDMQ